ncbi:lymphocyte antigen 6E [Suncus etruscus]|uniref:lymphocyte antigen 6E n=1 Tax=Suncus etruscus TaxID=109475 RepID=UPI002110CFEE|nr:lymphocyte antigen 6E [Suncus etruscus]
MNASTSGIHSSSAHRFQMSPPATGLLDASRVGEQVAAALPLGQATTGAPSPGALRSRDKDSGGTAGRKRSRGPAWAQGAPRPAPDCRGTARRESRSGGEAPSCRYPALCSRGPRGAWRRRGVGTGRAARSRGTQQGSCAFRMKAALALLLVALLATEPARALMCFSCSNQKSNWFCLKPTICSSEDNYCVTSTASLGIGENKAYELNKGCSPMCAGVGVDLGLMSVGTRCCESFLCNFSAADGGLRVSTPVLCLGVLFSLLQALLRLYP